MTIHYRKHALQRMFQRGVSSADIHEVLRCGVVIEDYPQDFPYASRLIFHAVNGRPLHIVVANDAETGDTIVITAYEPDLEKWLPGFRVRKGAP